MFENIQCWVKYYLNCSISLRQIAQVFVIGCMDTLKKYPFLDVLRLPIPEIIYSNYTGDEVEDVFVLENLMAADFNSYKDGDLQEETLKSCLECLAQLHGTGLAYKLHVGGSSKIMEKFPHMEEQAQLKVLKISKLIYTKFQVKIKNN